MNKILLFIIIVLSVLAALIVVDYILKRFSDKGKEYCLSENIPYVDNKAVMRYRYFHKYFSNTLVYGVLIGVCLLALFPFFWMITSSLKTPLEAVSVTDVRIFAKQPQWGNYAKIFDTIDIFTGLKNTIIVEVAVIPVMIFMSSLEAYAFAKMRLRHKNTFLLILLSGLMIPYASVLLPQYKAYFALGLTNTLWPLILPSLFGNVAVMFFFIQFMRGIPSALFEAAKIDGSGYFKSFLVIMIPLSGPAIAAQVVFCFVSNWNDFFAPSIYLATMNSKTLQVLLQALVQSQADRPMLFTGAFITCIPLFIIYLIFQKYFVGSLAISGIKG